MTTLIIPTQSTPNYSETIELDGQVYGFRFYWNTRVGAWFFDVLDPTNNVILAGRRLVLGDLLLHQFHHLAIPPGEMAAFDNLNKDHDAIFADVGVRVLLLYYPQADIQALIASVS